MKKLFTITELSNLTHKTRPTLYRYIASYDDNDYRDIPYLFVQLFMLIDQENTSRNDVINYCDKNFIDQCDNEDFKEFMLLIKSNKDKINFKKLTEDIRKEYEGVILCQPVKKNF